MKLTTLEPQNIVDLIDYRTKLRKKPHYGRIVILNNWQALFALKDDYYIKIIYNSNWLLLN